MDYIKQSQQLAQEFIANRGGILPSLQYSIKVPGVGRMFCLPESEPVKKYWIMSSEIYRHCGWHSPACLISAIEELPESEYSMVPMMLSTGEVAKMHVVNQDGLMPLLLNNVSHFDLGLSFLACAWGYIFAQKKNGYERIPDPLKTSLQFWDIVNTEDSQRMVDMQTLRDTFGISEEEILAIVETKMEKVWDAEKGRWVFKNL